MRLNKYLSNAGVASRRKCDDLIKAGQIRVNGQVVNTLGAVIDENNDVIEYNGKTIKPKVKYVYILLNKPTGVVASADDEFDRQTVVDLVPVEERIYPVGRLDYDTTGVLLLTDDGELTNRLIHPNYKVIKVYRVLLNKKIKPIDLHHLRNGVMLEEKMTQACVINELRIMDNQSYLEIELKEGRNRQIRKMFALFGYSVEQLDRVSFAGFTSKGLRQGEWRYLDEMEIRLLKEGVDYGD